MNVLLLFLVLLVLGVLLAPGMTRANQVSPRPNVVVIMADDQDYQSMPVMRKLLAYPQGSWVNFTNMYSPTSICSPARAIMLTGQYAANNGVYGIIWGPNSTMRIPSTSGWMMPVTGRASSASMSTIIPIKS